MSSLAHQKMDEAAMRYPMAFLTWVSGVCLLAMFELDAELLGKFAVAATSLCTLILAWYKRKIERENQHKLETALREILEIQVENARLKEQNFQFENERRDFRREIRGKIEQIENQSE